MSDEIVVGNVVTIALGYLLGRYIIALGKWVWAQMQRMSQE